MDLRGLRHVVVLSRLLSYTKAARELHLTQSALSRSIQAIEKDAHVNLFDRDRGGVVAVALLQRRELGVGAAAGPVDVAQERSVRLVGVHPSTSR